MSNENDPRQTPEDSPVASSAGLYPINAKRLSLSEIEPQMRVAYVPTHAQWDRTAIEYGTVSSKNTKYVFVKFEKQVSKFGWEGTTSKSCQPGDLVGV